jgi:hypothetical protein
MPLYKSLIFVILLFVSSSLILAFKYSFFLFLKCLLASRLTSCRLTPLLWFGFCKHWILACSLLSKNCAYSASNHGLCCFRSRRPRLSWAQILIFSLTTLWYLSYQIRGLFPRGVVQTLNCNYYFWKSENVLWTFSRNYGHFVPYIFCRSFCVSVDTPRCFKNYLHFCSLCLAGIGESFWC